MNKLTVIAIFAVLICFNSFGQKKKKPAIPEPEVILTNSVDSFSYALGIEYATGLKNYNINNLNLSVFEKAFNDVTGDKDKLISPDDTKTVINDYFTNLQKTVGEDNLKKSKGFLEENKKKEGVVELASGLQYKIIINGDGPKPTIEDNVLCHYKGTLLNGKIFDSSYDRNEPITFPLNGVIKGWTEALQLMGVGSKWILYIPADLAYGESGAGNDIGPNETLIFEVELLDINPE